MQHVLGLDLASVNDFTAASALRVSPSNPRHMFCGLLERWRAPYPETVERVCKLANTPMLKAAILAVDQTGVGKPVVDMLRAALPGRRVIGITITAGSVATRGTVPDDVRVPKNLLVSTLQALLANKRLKWSQELALMPALQNELQVFRVKITPNMNETFEAWREKDHDDLVLSLGLAAWVAENLPKQVTDSAVESWVYTDQPVSKKEQAAGEKPKTRLELLREDHPDLFDAE